MNELGAHFRKVICDTTNCRALRSGELIQELWSGYGRILRVQLDGGDRASVIVKHVCLPTESMHPRGWNSSRSHQRKVTSYEVETTWYRTWSGRCLPPSRIPRFLGADRQGNERLLILEDLDAAGFPARVSQAGWDEVALCLRWLANFHATFLGAQPEGLWDVGTYWHLATRPDEFQALQDEDLKRAAAPLDARLTNARHQTIVHGDAKLANFCFAPAHDAVAAVDFQYVGGGCGMKDVAYLVGSCFDDHACGEMEVPVLDCYFEALREALAHHQPATNADDLVAEWRPLYPIAWTDFHRFLMGWSPGHWKVNAYSDRVARAVLRRLDGP